MKRRFACLAAAIGLFFTAIGYDTHIAAKVFSARRAAEDLARRNAMLARQTAFRAPAEAATSPSSTNTGSNLGNNRISGPGGIGTSDPKFSSSLMIASDPKARSNYLALYRDGLDVQYGLLMHMLGLSPAEEAQLKQLLADSEANKLAVAQAAADRGLDTDDPQMKALQNQLNRTDWNSMKELLGTDGLAALRQYWSEYPTVTFVQNFGGNLPDASLTMNQARQLLPVLSAASQHDANGNVIKDTINVQQALAGAASVLTPEQLLMLSATLQEAEAKVKLAQLSASP